MDPPHNMPIRLWNMHKEGVIYQASNIPWARTINDSNGRFKRFVELKATLSRNGITPDEEVIGYCRTGERASMIST
jgi:thiosulfate/3-mercaptopyruvate sulfurtransferase